MRVMRCRSLPLAMVRPLALAAHGFSRLDSFSGPVPPHPGGVLVSSTAGQPTARSPVHQRAPRATWRWLTLVGLLLGILLLALPRAPIAWPPPDLPSPVVRTALYAALALASGEGIASLPGDGVSLEPDDLDDTNDDDSSTLAVLPAQALHRPPVPAHRDSLGVTSARLWPSHYLWRPQLLTR
jgi:hypothetical protein